MTDSPISKKQLTKAQVLFAQWLKLTGVVAADPRPLRLEWVSILLKRPVGSFAELTMKEAKLAIDTLNISLGDQARRYDRTTAQRMGTDGRKHSRSNSATLASAADLDRIQSALTRLSWSREKFEKWLASPRSPLRGRLEVRTQADANRVWWGLKRIMKEHGVWQ